VAVSLPWLRKACSAPARKVPAQAKKRKATPVSGRGSGRAAGFMAGAVAGASVQRDLLVLDDLVPAHDFLAQLVGVLLRRVADRLDAEVD